MDADTVVAAEEDTMSSLQDAVFVVAVAASFGVDCSRRLVVAGKRHGEQAVQKVAYVAASTDSPLRHVLVASAGSRSAVDDCGCLVLVAGTVVWNPFGVDAESALRYLCGRRWYY